MNRPQTVLWQAGPDEGGIGPKQIVGNPDVLTGPAIYPCGCSRWKVAFGLCDARRPDGTPRTEVTLG